MGGYYLLVVVAAGLNLMATTILTTMAYIEDLRAELANLNAIDIPEENSIEIRAISPGFIRLHVHALQLSATNTTLAKRILYVFNSNCRCVSNFVDIYKTMFMVIFSWSLIAICAALLGVKIELVQFSI